MKHTAKIIKKLLTDGQFDSKDSDLFVFYQMPEVREDLDLWGEELGFSIKEISGTVYMLPHADSTLLASSMKDIREDDSKSDKLIDAFLKCYIIMIILWMFYGGKNANPKKSMFIQINDIVEKINERAADVTSETIDTFEKDMEINFSQISAHWNARQIDDGNKRNTKKGTVLTACRLMVNQKLFLLVDNDNEIRPTQKLDDLMMGYYLHDNRVKDMHTLFQMMEGSTYA